ncbi:hypothetical protein LCGC14_2633400 [marine sediment metagenome]|uniref:Uncharacterized protein n=1 Tax=marine sediment metagenome TaxID=412755 RepID=A0A0F9CAN7_9ZZZZ
MFVIHRTDKNLGQFTRTHKALDKATEEARRLAKHHATEKPTFVVYELIPRKQISADIVIKEIDSFEIVDGER